MVKRLRHRPFTAVTRVRVPVGSPQKGRSEDLPFVIYADVVELADTQDLGSCADGVKVRVLSSAPFFA